LVEQDGVLIAPDMDPIVVLRRDDQVVSDRQLDEAGLVEIDNASVGLRVFIRLCVDVLNKELVQARADQQGVLVVDLEVAGVHLMPAELFVELSV